MDQQIDRKPDAQDSNCKTNNSDDGLKGPRFPGNPRGLLFLGIHETGKFVLQGGGDCFFVFKFVREPLTLGRFPFLRQAQ